MSAATLPNASSHSFRLTEEQEQLRREIRAFAAKEIAPNVMEWDETSEFPSAVVKQLGEMGLLGMLIPVRAGRRRARLRRLHDGDRGDLGGRWLGRHHHGRA